MLTRLLVLAAVIGAFFVFVPTASAGAPVTPAFPLPEACVGIDDPADLTDECREALLDLIDGGTLPESCEDIIGGDGDGGGTPGPVPVPDAGAEGDGDVSTSGVLDDITGGELLQIIRCLTDLTGGDGGDDNNDTGGDGGGTGDAGTGGEGDLGQVGDEGFGDEGNVPEGGIESGYGPTGSEEAGAPLAARGAALLALVGVLATGLVVMRRRRSGS